MKRGLEAPRCSRHRVTALLALVAATTATAQTPPAATTLPPNPPMAVPAAPPVFAIRGFQVDGENPLGEGETARVLAPYLRSNATIETLQQATATLEAALRDRGFGLHKVALPPQEVGDTVRLQIIKFTIGKVDTQGRKFFGEDNIRRSVPELREGTSPNFRTLAIQTAIANENANKQIQVGLRESEQQDKIDATITVRDQKPWNFGVGISNLGTRETGRDRLTVSGSHSNLFDLDHQMVAAYTTSLDKPSDVRQVGLSYRAPLYPQGGVIGATYTHSDVVGDFGTFNSTGAGHTFGVSYTHYLAPEGGRRSYVTVGLEDRVYDASRIDGVVVPGTLDRRSRPLTLGYTARRETDTSLFAYNLDLVFNTGSGANNSVEAYRTEDPRIDTERWKAIRGGLSYSSTLAKTWLWTARAQYQYSPDALISGEQFGLGGLGSVRGSEVERPLAGDSGVSGSFEITTPELTSGLRALGFVDAGYISNNEPNTLLKPGSDRLASVGLGLRYSQGIWTVSADYGYIVLGSRVPLTVNSAAPKKGDDRFYLNLSVRF